MRLKNINGRNRCSQVRVITLQNAILNKTSSVTSHLSRILHFFTSVTNIFKTGQNVSTV